MRILITGGAGFIGSHLCERMLEEGHEVFCLDNFHTGTKANIAHLLDQDQFHLLQRDVTEPLQIKVDRIYNLACPASPVQYQNAPIRTLHTSVSGIVQMLELAQKDGARLLQASTSEVYGDPHVHPQVESYWGNVNPLGPRSCYDEGKRVAETYCQTYARQRQVDVRIARIFNTYGPRMQPNDGRVVSNFVTQALADAPLTMYGEGQQTRSFCFISDMIDALPRLMEADVDAMPVNLGNPSEFTIEELARLVLRLTESSSRIIRRSLPPDDPTRRCPDISRAQQLLRWKPEVSLEDGLQRVIEYFRNTG